MLKGILQSAAAAWLGETAISSMPKSKGKQLTRGVQGWESGDGTEDDFAVDISGDAEDFEEGSGEEEQCSPPARKPASKANKGGRPATAKASAEQEHQAALTWQPEKKELGRPQKQKKEGSLQEVAKEQQAAAVCQPKNQRLGHPREQQEAAVKGAKAVAQQSAAVSQPVKRNPGRPRKQQQAEDQEHEEKLQRSNQSASKQLQPDSAAYVSGAASQKQPVARGRPPQKVKRAAAATEDAGERQEVEEEERPTKRTRVAAKPQPSAVPTHQQKQQRWQTRGSNQSRQQAAAPLPADDSRKQQQSGRSPTPVAAAAAEPLEMSAPPSGGDQLLAPAAAAARQLAQRQNKARTSPLADEAGRVQNAGALGEVGEQDWGWHTGVEDEGEEAGDEADADPAIAACECMLARIVCPCSQEAATLKLRRRAQEAYDQLLASVNDTVDNNLNNSLLIMGPRGSGKTTIIERALAAVESQWNTDPRDPVVGVVRLSGLYHAEERVAFREVARQLCEVFKYSFSRGASIQENIEFLRGMLGALARSDKAAVVVLEEFDLFATRHSKQKLLYNLLDALQTSGMQAAVLCVTCRHDVVEVLEKRVKSRFSHRKLELSLPSTVLPKAPRQAEAGGGGVGASVQDTEQDGTLDVLKEMLSLPQEFPHHQFAAVWNASVASAAGAPEVATVLQCCINVYPSLHYLANIADDVLAQVMLERHRARHGGRPGSGSSGTRPASMQLTAAQLVGAIERQLAQAKSMVRLVAGLPVLDLIMLVAAYRLKARGQEDFNFERVYCEFKKYSLRGNHVDGYEKVAAEKAYDHLLGRGLVAFVDPRSEGRIGARHTAAAYLLLPREEIEEGLETHWNCPQDLKEWFKREGGLGGGTTGPFL